jgi:SNF2-related domain/Helicase conserved C-terminal domain
MTDPFALVDAADAQVYLAVFDARTRRKGEAYFRQGRVQNLQAVGGGPDFAATVQGSALYTVRLSSDPDEGWIGECSCPVGTDCKHLYAAMKTLLAEHSLAAVRSLSTVAKGAAPKGSHPAPGRPASPAPNGDLAHLVKAALGRPLRPLERRFLEGIRTLYARSSQTRGITRWDFEELGLHLGGYSWEALHIWPAFPQTEHEFWLYVAQTARDHQQRIPPFLEPVTDLAPIQDRLRQWRRTQEIEQWNQKLNSLCLPNRATPRSVDGEWDLRVVVGESSATLSAKRPGADGFEPLKTSKVRQLLSDCDVGLQTVSPRSELIWQTWAERSRFGRSMQLDYHDPDARRLLGRLLRLRVLDDQIVTPQGQPLARPAEPLRWELIPAVDDADDYRLRLVGPNGSATCVRCALPGSPALYLAGDAVWSGPVSPDSVLPPTRETVIPAPAVETPAGVEFLQSIGVELPPRVRERVRFLPMHVAIRCELSPIHPGSRNEECLFTVTAQDTEGRRQETWTGEVWLETTPATRRRRASHGPIFLHDRSAMADLPRLLEPLELKRNRYSNTLSLRVTRRFPEVFVPWLKSLPPHITVQLDGELASLAQGEVSGRVRLDASEAEIDWFDLRVVLDVSDTTLTAEEVKLLLDARGAFVRLGKKGWRRLRFDLTAEDDERLARLGLSPRELTTEPQRLHALQLADDSARSFLPAAQIDQIERRVADIKAGVTPDLPAGITADLRPYQRDGFNFLAYLATNRFGGILADDMGLGKTLQTLVWLVWLRASGLSRETRPSPTLVVCPKSVIDNWRAEAERFTPGLRVRLWAASELDTFLDRLAEADLHVLNYSQLRLLGANLAPVRWLAVILDEGQYIKNPSSQTAQAARALQAEHRLVLSGTPIENRLLDLWSLLAFAMPGVLGSRAGFARIYDAQGDPFARRRLAARVRPFLLRRTKAQVAQDLPDRIEEDLFCEIEGEQLTLYRAELKRAQQLLLRVKTQKELARQQFHFLTSLLRLRQICCHPALVKPDTKAAGAKLVALLEQLEPLMEEGHKVLVFSQFVQLLALVKPVVGGRDWPMFYLAGETENRGELVRQFQEAEGAAVFLISLKAGGFGLNLTAASYVILFDPWWNPAVENQAIDRTHRIGQTNKVIAYRLLIKDSIEEKIRRLQKQKQALAEDVLGEEKFAQSLTLQDLHFLFAD